MNNNIESSEIVDIVCNNNPLAIAIFDMKMVYLFASEKWYQHYHITDKNILGQSHYDVFPEILDKPDWLDMHNKVLRGETFTQPHDAFEREDGSTQYIRWVMKPWYHEDSNEQGGAVLYSEDVTSQRELELERECLVNKLEIEIANKEALEAKLMAQAMTDPLTGLHNRRYFEQACEDEVKKVDRYHLNFSIVMFDIDFFKKVNDVYGHDVGDETLKLVADILNSSMRETDICARWGGEEFIVLVETESAEVAFEFAQRVRILIAETLFPKIGHLTISAGVSAYIPKTPVETCIKEADEALYQAKSSGRNRVEIYQK